MMKFEMAALILTIASASPVRRAADTMCQMLTVMGHPSTDDPVETKSLMDKFAGLMAPKMDCSDDPSNRVLGYNLKGVSFADCTSAVQRKFKAQTQMIGTAKFVNLKCFETMVDVEANTAVLWSTIDVFGNGKETGWAAMRISMEGEKINGYHFMYDTYQVFALAEKMGRSGWLQSRVLLGDRAMSLVEHSEIHPISVVGTSSAGRAVQALCGLWTAMGQRHIDWADQEQTKVAMEEFSGMLAEKLDCSQVPSNPILGFDLKDVSYADCTKAALRVVKVQSEMIGGMRMGHSTNDCTDTIVDEQANKATVWMEMSTQDEQGNNMFVQRSAMRLNMDGDKIAGYHTVFDSYQFFVLAEEFEARQSAVSLSSSVARAADGLCELFKAMGVADTANVKELQVVMDNYGAMMAETVDCSQNPNNPELGFNLKNVPYARCSEAAMKSLEVQRGLVGGMKLRARCIKKVEDTKSNSAAIWIEMTQQDEHGNHMLTTRGAVRLDTNGDKIIGSHWIYDTYQLYALANTLARERDGAISLSRITSSRSVAAVALVLAGFVAMAVALKRKKIKDSYALLADDVNA